MTQYLTMTVRIVDDNQLDLLLTALGDPTRRHILELLASGPRTATDLYREFAIAGPAVSRHLRVLRESGLVSDHPVAGDKRVRLYRLEGRPLTDLARWLDDLGRGWQGQLDAFKDYVALRSARKGAGRP